MEQSLVYCFGALREVNRNPIYTFVSSLIPLGTFICLRTKGTCLPQRQCGQPENGTLIGSHVPHFRRTISRPTGTNDFRLLEVLSIHTNNYQTLDGSKTDYSMTEELSCGCLEVSKSRACNKLDFRLTALYCFLLYWANFLKPSSALRIVASSLQKQNLA